MRNHFVHSLTLQRSIRSLSDLLRDCKKENEIYIQVLNTHKTFALDGEIAEKVIEILDNQLAEWQKQFEAI
ncbi:hypothetical protein [Pectinatus frisingensis]|uniref:hypothetical protein n=1 Tax=Pectinatus frisingensis TaxID=865 RepID=UPI0018C68F4A|nr:hypothetical protein [Pectinatus frisingensis]